MKAKSKPTNPAPLLHETAVNLVSEGTVIRWKIVFDHVTRVHGTLEGDVHAKPGSLLVLGETGVVQGGIRADRLIIDGFVRGDIEAETQVKISRTGRVLGDILCPSLEVEFGGHFDGKCRMEKAQSVAVSKPAINEQLTS